MPRYRAEKLKRIIRTGKKIESIAKALGMSVRIADRKGTPVERLRPGRSSFTEILQASDVIILAVPLDESTHNLISEYELQQIRSTGIVVNVSRGGVMDECALAQALKEGCISGAATDVFSKEPARKGGNVLLDADKPVPNLIISPHVAWYASSSIKNLQDTIKANVEGFLDGEPRNLVGLQAC